MTLFRDPELRDATPSVMVVELSSFTSDKVPLLRDAVPSVMDREVNNLSDDIVAPVSVAVPSVTVPADNRPFRETAVALVSDPDPSDATPSVMVVDVKSFSGERVPVEMDATPSVTVPAVN